MTAAGLQPGKAHSVRPRLCPHGEVLHRPDGPAAERNGVWFCSAAGGLHGAGHDTLRRRAGCICTGSY